MDDVALVKQTLVAAESDIWGNPSKLQAPALAALARLEARIAELERERDDALMEADGWHTHVARAEAAEARCERYEKALRAIREEFTSPHSESGYDGDPVELMAAAALAEEPHTDVAGTGQVGCG